MDIIVTTVSLLLAMFFLFIAITIMKMSDEDYNRHRKLLLHPERDTLGDTVTVLSIENGKWVAKKRASIGATKRLINKVWNYD